jgi:hypothetical protein
MASFEEMIKYYEQKELKSVSASPKFSKTEIAEIKKMKLELKSIDAEVEYNTGLLKEVKNEISLRHKEYNNSKEVNNLLIFMTIFLAFILILGSKKIAKVRL